MKDGLPVLVLDTLGDPDSVEDCLLLLLCIELPVYDGVIVAQDELDGV